MPGGAPGQSAKDIEYTAVYAPADNVTTTNGEYTSTGTDEEAILVDGDITVTVKDTKVIRSSADSTGGDASSFYGVGAAVLGKGGTTYLKNLTIDTDAKGGAGVFAYDDGVVYVADTVRSAATGAAAPWWWTAAPIRPTEAAPRPSTPRRTSP